MTNTTSTNTSTSTASTPRDEEFSSFCIAIDKVLINPNTKEGIKLYKDLSKTNISDEDRLEGKGSEGEKFRKHLKEIQTRGNFKDILTFEVNGKVHDLANAPEITSIEELVEFNNSHTWNHLTDHAANGAIVKLSDKPKTSNAEKQHLRETIDRRAKNQIIRVFLNKILDPELYSTIIGKASNAEYLHRKDTDNNDDTIIDGAVLLLLVAQRICPSTIALVENLKVDAADLKLKDFGHDVSAVINKFEEIMARIRSHGKTWDDEIPTLFKVLATTEDAQFKTAIELKENDHSAGLLTELSQLTSYATAIYTNRFARKTWMVPDAKQIRIAALVTKIDSLEASIATGAKSAFTSDAGSGSSGSGPRNFRPLDPWRYEHKGDKLSKDGKDWFWCDHSSHKRDGACTNGMYCHTHGKGHPEHDHTSWITWKKANPFGKRKKADQGQPAASAQSSSSSGGISLNEKLKNALLTRTACTEADIAALSQQDF